MYINQLKIYFYKAGMIVACILSHNIILFIGGIYYGGYKNKIS